MQAGVLVREFPWQQVSEVLEHVFGEEGSEGSHHPDHGVQHGEQRLHCLQAVVSTLLALGGRGSHDSHMTSHMISHMTSHMITVVVLLRLTLMRLRLERTYQLVSWSMNLTNRGTTV